MKKQILLTILSLSSALSAATIAVQNFDSLSDASTVISSGVSTNQALPNQGSFSNSGAGINFSTIWTDTRGEGTGPVTASGDSSDTIGVNSFSGSNAPNVNASGVAYASGIQHNFLFNDGDGNLSLLFAGVDTSGFDSRTLTLDYWVADTDFEATDAFSITLSDGVTPFTTITTLSGAALTAAGTGDAGNASEWNSVSFDIEASGLGDNLFLTINADTSANTENIFVDNITFSGNAIAAPEPSTALLILLGIFALSGRRR